MKLPSPSRQALFGFAAICLAVGSIVGVFTLTWVIITPEFLSAAGPMSFPKDGWTAFAVGAVLLIIGVAAGMMTTTRPRPPKEKGKNPNSVMFGGVIVGLGFVFLVDAILNLIAFSGFAKTGLLGQVFPIFSAVDSALATSNAVSAIRLFISLGMAVLGALFFVTNSLRDKRERKRESYSERKFWSGLWFRLGEAVLFTVVFFLALRHYAPDSEQLLPLIALSVGMFVTTGETLVFGIAQRVLKGAAAVVGTEKRDGPRDEDKHKASSVREGTEVVPIVSKNGHGPRLGTAHHSASSSSKRGK